MANRFAVVNGSFDDINTWSSTPGGPGGASVPGAGDVAHANGRTVAITNSIEVTSINNTNANGATAGGGFTCSVSDITLLIPDANATTNSSLITYSGSGQITIPTISNQAYSLANSNLIVNSGSGNIYIQSANYIQSSGNNSFLVRNSSNGTITIDAIATTANNINGAILINSSSGAIYINSGATISSTAGAIVNSGSGLVYVANSILSGSLLGSNASPAVQNQGAGSLTVVNCVVEASSTSNAINVGTNANAVNRISGIFKHHANGTAPITGLKWSLGTTPTESYYRASLNGTSTFLNYYQAGSAEAGTNHAMPADVRNGTLYGPSNELTGTCHVPAAASVAAGVPVDNTVGTAVLTPAAVQAIVGAIVADAIDA